VLLKEWNYLFMESKICFFIGSRHAPCSIKERLTDVVEQHIAEYCVNTFTVGHYGAFDSLVIGVLQEAKKRHDDLKLYLLARMLLTRKKTFHLALMVHFILMDWKQYRTDLLSFKPIVT